MTQHRSHRTRSTLAAALALGLAATGAAVGVAFDTDVAPVSAAATDVNVTRARIVEIARAELAKAPAETNGNNIVRYGNGTGALAPYNKNRSWCADFASWVWQQAGVGNPWMSHCGLKNSDGSLQVGTIQGWAAKNTEFRSLAQGARVGDLMLFGSNGNCSHVTIVVGVRSDGAVQTIGGNESDRVTFQNWRFPAQAGAYGFAAPAKGGTTPTTVPTPPPAGNGNRIGFVDGIGTLKVKEGPLNATWTTVAAGVRDFDLEGDRIAILTTDGDVLVKEGPLNATWTTVANNATEVDLEGTRIAFRRTNGDVLVKEGPLNATWTTVAQGIVTATDLEGTRIAILTTNGDVLVKEGPLNATWTTVANNATEVDLEGTRIAFRRTNGDVLVKEGPLNATWTTVAQGIVTATDLEGTRIAILTTNGDVLVKEGPLNATWTTVANNATEVDLEGTRIAFRRTNGDVLVKEGPLNATWTTVVSSGATDMDLSD